jgi:DNA replicative helicase MCM subunit Mcm2 (Cdc46/Mcm family)
MAKEELKFVKYRCTKCGEEDTGKYYENEPISPVINCWKCHAGFQKDIDYMIQNRVGMFVVQEPAASPTVN